MILWVTEKPQLDKKLKPGSACTDQIWREKEGVKHTAPRQGANLRCDQIFNFSGFCAKFHS